MKFCTKCGAALVNGEISHFSHATGDKVYSQVCPTKICEHTGIGHLLGREAFFSGKRRCLRDGCSYYELPFQGYAG